MVALAAAVPLAEDFTGGIPLGVALAAEAPGVAVQDEDSKQRGGRGDLPLFLTPVNGTMTQLSQRVICR